MSIKGFMIIQEINIKSKINTMSDFVIYIIYFKSKSYFCGTTKIHHAVSCHGFG